MIEQRNSIAPFALITALVVAAMLNSSASVAQDTPYGQDVVPGAVEEYRPWSSYGVDPVPPTIPDNSAYLRSYGFDFVPGTPLDDQIPVLPQGNVRQVFPGQTLQVLTGAVED